MSPFIFNNYKESVPNIVTQSTYLTFDSQQPIVK